MRRKPTPGARQTPISFMCSIRTAIQYRKFALISVPMSPVFPASRTRMARLFTPESRTSIMSRSSITRRVTAATNPLRCTLRKPTESGFSASARTDRGSTNPDNVRKNATCPCPDCASSPGSVLVQVSKTLIWVTPAPLQLSKC